MSKRGSLSRRQILRAAAGAATAYPWLAAEPTASVAQTAKSTGNQARIALIGCGGQGMGVAKHARSFGSVQAVCDVDANHLKAAVKEFPGAKAYADFRRVMERDDIDVVINGTPDHWHTLINLAAIGAGKDVYCEKPLTLTIDEGKRLVAAVDASGQILQTGSQQRSDARFRSVCELVRNGRLGDISEVQAWLPASPHKGPFKPAAVPAELDWDMWLGQAPVVEYVPERCHGYFRYWLDYSGGTMTDWGAHHNDIVLWALGLDRSGPVKVSGKALVEQIPDGFDAPSEYYIEFHYRNGIKHTVHSTTADGRDGSPQSKPKLGEMRHGVKFIGSEGWIFVTRGRAEASDPKLLTDPLPPDAARLYVSDDHVGNFFDCVRSRNEPIAPAVVGHRAATVCHLGVIAIRLGRELTWDPDAEKFPDDSEAEQYVSREMRAPWNSPS